MSDYNYRCPSCGGEFDTWDNALGSGNKECPFCGREKGGHGVTL